MPTIIRCGGLGSDIPKISYFISRNPVFKQCAYAIMNKTTITSIGQTSNGNYNDEYLYLYPTGNDGSSHVKIKKAGVYTLIFYSTINWGAVTVDKQHIAAGTTYTRSLGYNMCDYVLLLIWSID